MTVHQISELEAFKARIAEQDKIIANMKAQATRQSKHTLKVGKSGTVCLYHGARYPIAKYRSEWEHLIPFIKSGAIERFIEANAALLASDKV